MSNKRSRFKGAPWLEYLLDKDVLVVGAGGIGSWVTLCLARIGCRISLYDDDTIEIHNLGGQFLLMGDIGEKKVNSVYDLCGALCGEIIIYPEDSKYTNTSMTNNIVISAVDNMATRKIIFEKWLDTYKDDQDALFIDGRLLAEDYQVYGVTPDGAEAYRATLFDDNDIPTEDCTFKATTHCSLGITSDIIGVLTNWAANRISASKGEYQLRDVPFKIVKSIPNFLYDLTFNNEQRTNNQGHVHSEHEELEEVTSRAD